MRIVSQTAGLPKSTENENWAIKIWNRFWNSSLQIQKRKFIPCVLEVASGTLYCQELESKGSSSSRSLFGTAWVGDLVTLNFAKATPPTSPKMELGRYQLPFFPFKTKVLLSERISKVTKEILFTWFDIISRKSLGWKPLATDQDGEGSILKAVLFYVCKMWLGKSLHCWLPLLGCRNQDQCGWPMSLICQFPLHSSWVKEKEETYL